MKIAIMQPYFFPYIGYFQLINTADKFVILDDVNYISRGWINRNNILVNGKKTLFTLPVLKASQNKLIKEIEISIDKKWKRKFSKTIEMTYKKAPFFSQTLALVEKVLNFESKSLTDFLYNSLLEVCTYLEIDTKIEKTSSIYQNSALKADNKIIDICKQEKGTIYINPIGGQELYKQEKFTQEGIELYFLNTGQIDYQQFSKEFVPYLSIIDIMMFNSPSKIKKILTNFELK
jgi:hypothetical protein